MGNHSGPQSSKLSIFEFPARYGQEQSRFFRGTSKPYVRWWWLCGPFTREDIVRQLRWVRDAGFGGVELAWLYPGWRAEEMEDDSRPVWLGQEWRDLLSFTKTEADALRLGCDFTFGSSWPFGGSCVEAGDAAQTFDGLSQQQLHGSWEDPDDAPTFVVNHLSSAALARYADPLLSALGDALKGSTSALFCDSLEVNTHRMWSQELWSRFEERFGYSLHPFVNDLDTDTDVRYDYRKLTGETIQREFYDAFTKICREHNAYARVQCHGAPTDLLQAYAAVDVPECESLLFPPSFSRIAASAAAWSGKQIVSAEAFTCIYGFPGWDAGAQKYWKKEKTGDLKLLADALFAHGVNQIVWHGMPYQPSDKEVEFYASVHVGPDSPFAPELATFNAYLEKVSSLLKLGETHSCLGIYLPFEDALMIDRLPEDKRTPGANFHWEMRHAVPPAEVEAYQPLWISYAFLKDAAVDNGFVRSRELSLQCLYVDCEWLDADSLVELHRLANKGATLIWKRRCRQPGRFKNSSYPKMLDDILAAANVLSNPAQLSPLLRGEELPPYWARVLDEDLLIFFAHPSAKQIRYPMRYGLSAESGIAERELGLRWGDRESPLQLRFEPCQSLMLTASAGGSVEITPIEYNPNSRSNE